MPVRVKGGAEAAAGSTSAAGGPDRASTDLDAVRRPVRSGLLVGGGFKPPTDCLAASVRFRIPDKLIAGIRETTEKEGAVF